MYPKHAPRVLPGVLLAAVLLAVGPGIPSSSAHAATASEDPSPLHIDFPGGTVEEYIAHLREIVPEANIVLMPDASKVRIPQVKIKAPDGSLITVVKLLEQITAASAEPDVRVYWDGLHMLVRLVEPEAAPGSSQPAPRLSVRSFSLANVMVEGHIGPEEILRNIETSLEMATGTEDLPELRFHESTNLLIVRGRSDHINTIAGTLSSMRESAVEIRARQPTEKVDELQKGLKASAALIQELILEIRELRERLNRLEGKQE